MNKTKGKQKLKYVYSSDSSDLEHDNVRISRNSALCSKRGNSKKESVHGYKADRVAHKGKENYVQGSSRNHNNVVIRPVNRFGGFERDKTETYYRSNLSTAIRELNGLKLQPCHVEMMKHTPFWHLFNAIYNENYEKMLKRCRKYEGDIVTILKHFHYDSGCFVIGGVLVPVFNTDAQYILGLSGGDIRINLKGVQYKSPAWVLRCFAPELSDPTVTLVLYKKLVLNRLSDTLMRTDNDSCKDVARLLCSYLLVMILAPNQNSSMSPHLTDCLEDFALICKYDWSSYVVDFLISQIKNSSTLRVGGCAVLLQYWLCEHTHIVERGDTCLFPRILNWHMGDLNKALSRLSLSKVGKVNKYALRPTSLEREQLISIGDYRDLAIADAVDKNKAKDESVGNDCNLGSCQSEFFTDGSLSNPGEGSSKVNAVKMDTDTPINSPKQASIRKCAGLNGWVEEKKKGKIKSENIQMECEAMPSQFEETEALSLESWGSGLLMPSFSINMTQYDKSVADANEAIRHVITELGVPSADQKNLNDAEEKIDIAVENCTIVPDIASLLAEMERIRQEMHENNARYEEEMKKRDASIEELKKQKNDLESRVVKKDTVVVGTCTQVFSVDSLGMKFSQMENGDSSRRSPIRANTDMDIYDKGICAIEGTPVSKNFKVSRYPSPSSCVLRVKGRNDRRPVILSPPTPQNAVLDLDQMDDFVEEGVNSMTGRVRWDYNVESVNKTEKKDMERLEEGLRNEGPGKIIWRGTQPMAEVTVSMLIDVVQNKEVADGVIDAWTDILMKKYADAHPVIMKTVVFTSSCWKLIKGNGTALQNSLERLIDERLETCMTMDTLVFPIMVQSNAGRPRIIGDHWTLLKLDMHTSEWKFFNSLLPRTRGTADAHLTHSLIVCKYVHAKLREIFKKHRPAHPYLLRPMVLPTSEDCMQQFEGSLDCGVILCQLIEKIMFKRPIRKGVYSLLSAGMYRARMVKWFMNADVFAP